MIIYNHSEMQKRLNSLEEARQLLQDLTEQRKKLQAMTGELSEDTTTADGRTWQHWRGCPPEDLEKIRQQREAIRTTGDRYSALYSRLKADLEADDSLTDIEKKVLIAFFLEGKGQKQAADDAGITRPEAVLILKNARAKTGTKSAQESKPVQLDLFADFA